MRKRGLENRGHKNTYEGLRGREKIKRLINLEKREFRDLRS